jgi:hypothetical protein
LARKKDKNRLVVIVKEKQDKSRLAVMVKEGNDKDQIGSKGER